MRLPYPPPRPHCTHRVALTIHVDADVLAVGSLELKVVEGVLQPEDGGQGVVLQDVGPDRHVAFHQVQQLSGQRREGLVGGDKHGVVTCGQYGYRVYQEVRTNTV